MIQSWENLVTDGRTDRRTDKSDFHTTLSDQRRASKIIYVYTIWETLKEIKILYLIMKNRMCKYKLKKKSNKTLNMWTQENFNWHSKVQWER